jgi:hypothetical protein
MIAFKKLVLAGFATLLVAGACTSINIPTIPPINIPSVPPNILPSGLVIPPVDVPSGSVPCALVTGAEVSQILGSAVTDTSDSATNCSFISASFWTVSVSTDTTSDFTGARFLLGSTAVDANIGGYPALTGTAFGVPAVYVQKPSGQLTVLGILTSDPTIMPKLQQIATIAVGRMP